MNQATVASLSIDQLERVLQRILGQEGALPEDWEAEATTYDLPRFHSEAEFLDRFESAGQRILAEEIHDAPRLRALLAGCGHPYDYARLGHPLSTVYELYLRARTGAERAVSFASRTKAFLAPIEAPGRTGPVRLYAAGRLPLSDARKAALRGQQVEIHENWTGPLPAPVPGTLTLYVSDGPPEDPALAKIPADAVGCPVDEGGVLLLRPSAGLNPKEIQLIRKRTVAALLAANAKTELLRLVGLPVPADAPTVTEADCDELLRAIFPQLRASAYFCTGLAAEAAVFSATVLAAVSGARSRVTLFYAENGYGGTGQLITEILARDLIEPAPLRVLGKNDQGQDVTLIDRVIESLPALHGGPACVFLETPTNPELQVHDFPRLMAALQAYQAETGQQIPVLVDTTLAPLYPLFAQDFARDWPFLIVKSGSKYFTKGKATLGVVLCADNALAQRILAAARDYGRDADSFAKSSQLRALAQGLADLKPRMARIAAHTRELARQIQEQMRLRGHDITLYSMSDDQLESGLASGILSFYLPPAPTDHQDLVDEFVDYLLTYAPELVKNRVSYGQSSGNGLPDKFYVINPQESTQGSLPEAVKAAQKRDNVQICRISVPENADVAGLVRVMSGFFDRKYA
ncbi:MAG TPA: PLP-dependent transferase [Thermoanaerobaculia bacterium]|jgi:cystathionine beta-lyase/cystathionine gamma-synthase|nr:PLP-dependent transferase [Thermoanaerobaculia bacterium]